jgi:hypothetical protein
VVAVELAEALVLDFFPDATVAFAEPQWLDEGGVAVNADFHDVEIKCAEILKGEYRGRAKLNILSLAFVSLGVICEFSGESEDF